MEKNIKKRIYVCVYNRVILLYGRDGPNIENQHFSFYKTLCVSQMPVYTSAFPNVEVCVHTCVCTTHYAHLCMHSRISMKRCWVMRELSGLSHCVTAGHQWMLSAIRPLWESLMQLQRTIAIIWIFAPPPNSYVTILIPKGDGIWYMTPWVDTSERQTSTTHASFRTSPPRTDTHHFHLEASGWSQS